MTRVITETTAKARKEHKCNYCQMTIEKGHVYNRQYNEYEGDTYTFKMHTHCYELAQKLIDFKETDNGGADADDFYYTVMYKFEELTGKSFQGVDMRKALEVVRKELGV